MRLARLVENVVVIGVGIIWGCIAMGVLIALAAVITSFQTITRG
jgi:hypothetical protein